jgi:hypothetical protein
MTDLSDYNGIEAYSVDNPYGATRFTDTINLFEHNLKVNYNYVPNISDSTEDFPLDDKYVICIKHYVCGHLLRDDKDSHSHELGLEELTLYENCVVKANKFNELGGNIQLEAKPSTSYEMPYTRSI